MPVERERHARKTNNNPMEIIVAGKDVELIYQVINLLIVTDLRGALSQFYLIPKGVL